MASPIIVYSGGDNSDGSTRAKAYTTFKGGLDNAVLQGAPVWVYDDHVEPAITTGANGTFTAGATAAATVPILCINHTTGALASGVVIQSAESVSLTFLGYAYVDGIFFTAGAGTSGVSLLQFGSSTTPVGWTVANGKLTINSTNASSYIVAGTVNLAPYRLTLINTPLVFGAAGQYISLLNINFTWKNTPSAVQGTAVTALFQFGRISMALFEGVDLSGVASGKTILNNTSTTVLIAVDFKDCLLASGVNLLSTIGVLTVGSRVRAIRCASTAGNAVDLLYLPEGSVIDDTTVTLQGGASDDGSRLRSKLLKAVSPASVYMPLESNAIIVWNDGTAAMTVALEGIWDQAAAPTNADVWLEVEYLVDAGDPKGVFASTLNAIATGVGVVASTATWNGALSPSTKFRLVSPSFTPAQKGFLTIRVKTGNTTAAIRIDPKPILSTGVVPSKTYTGPAGTIINEIQATQTVPGPTQFVPTPGRRRL